MPNAGSAVTLDPSLTDTRFAEPPGVAPGALLSIALADLAERVRQSVVLVYRQGGNGAGVIWRSDGQIITNNHVVNPGGRTEIVLADGRKFVGIVAARHPTRDLAIVKIAVNNLPALPVTSSATVKAGQLVMAVGHPLGFRDAVTMGVLAYGPEPASENESDNLRADLWIRPGSSGGPLVDATGAVIGINTMVSGRLAMAIPSDAVEQFVNEHAMLAGASGGLGGLVIALHKGSFRTGFLVSEVVTGSSAEQSGLIIGDIILQVDGQDIASTEDLSTALRALTPGVTLPVLLSRGSVLHEIELSSDFPTAAPASSP